jgi:hypothetical protein
VRGVDGKGMHILDVLPDSFAHVPGCASGMPAVCFDTPPPTTRCCEHTKTSLCLCFHAGLNFATTASIGCTCWRTCAGCMWQHCADAAVHTATGAVSQEYTSSLPPAPSRAPLLQGLCAHGMRSMVGSCLRSAVEWYFRRPSWSSKRVTRREQD